MKKSFITIGVTTLVLSIILGNNSYSQSIELLTKDNEQYMPVKLFVEKLGGEYKEMEDGYTFNVNGKDITVKEYASFAKINGQYEPLDVAQVDGYYVPTDIESIYQEDEVFIPVWFLKSFQVADYNISGDNLIVEKEKIVVKAPVIDEEPEEIEENSAPTYTFKPKPKPPVNIEKPKEDSNEDNNKEPNNPGDSENNNTGNIPEPNNDDNEGSNNNGNSNENNNENNGGNETPTPNDNTEVSDESKKTGTVDTTENPANQ